MTETVPRVQVGEAGFNRELALPHAAELVAANQLELEGEVRRIYAEANAYADQVGGVEQGMNILYTPPRLRPRLMVVSMQGAGDDGVRQRK